MVLSVLLRTQQNMSSIRRCGLRGSGSKFLLRRTDDGRTKCSVASYHASFLTVQLSYYWCVGVVRGWIEELRSSCTENVIENSDIGTHKMEGFVSESKCRIWLISPQSVRGAWSKW